MKTLKNVLFSTMLCIGAFTTVTYVACNSDDCKNVVCANGGTCSGGTCVCPTGYTGSSCQNLAYIGTWKGTDNCTSGTYTNITIGIAYSSVDSTSLLVSNIGGFGSSVVIAGNLSSDSRTITFTNQDVGGSRTLSGTFTLTSSTTFNDSYVVTPAIGAADNCTGTFTKQ